MEKDVKVRIGKEQQKGWICVPQNSRILAVFAHGDEKNNDTKGWEVVVKRLNDAGVGTVRFDLMDGRELDKENIELFTDIVVGMTRWCMNNTDIDGKRIAYLGSGVGAAASLSAAAYYGERVQSVVVWGGRPDLTGEELDLIESPTLIVADGEDKVSVSYGRMALTHLGCEKKMELIAGLNAMNNEEAVEKAAYLSIEWIKRHFIG